MQCPYCKEEIKDGAIKCRYCGEFFDDSSNKAIDKIIKSKKPKYNYHGEIYYKDGECDIFCGNCGYEGHPDKKNKYIFFVRLPVLILCLIAWLICFLYGLWFYGERCNDNLICKCPKCGNTALYTNGNPEKKKGWLKSFIIGTLIFWSIALILGFIGAKFG